MSKLEEIFKQIGDNYDKVISSNHIAITAYKIVIAASCIVIAMNVVKKFT